MQFENVAVSARDDVAWATTCGMFSARADGEEMQLPARATFVLEGRDDTWLVVKAHFSSPIADEEVGHPLPATEDANVLP